MNLYPIQSLQTMYNSDENIQQNTKNIMVMFYKGQHLDCDWSSEKLWYNTLKNVICDTMVAIIALSHSLTLSNWLLTSPLSVTCKKLLKSQRYKSFVNYLSVIYWNHVLNIDPWLVNFDGDDNTEKRLCKIESKATKC